VHAARADVEPSAVDADAGWGLRAAGDVADRLGEAEEAVNRRVNRRVNSSV